MKLEINRNKPVIMTVNQRVLGSSPRGGAIKKSFNAQVRGLFFSSQRSFIIHETPMRPRKTIVLQKIVFLNALPFNFAKKGYNQNRTNALYNLKNTKF